MSLFSILRRKPEPAMQSNTRHFEPEELHDDRRGVKALLSGQPYKTPHPIQPKPPGGTCRPEDADAAVFPTRLIAE